MRVPVIALDNSFRYWMKYTDALQALRQRKIEEVFDGDGTFLGVLLRESPAKTAERFHRGSLSQSPTSLTKADCMANAEVDGSEKRQEIAKDKVFAWPHEHDRQNVVISGGMIHGATEVSSLPDAILSFA